MIRLSFWKEKVFCKMVNIKLISVSLLYNYVENGDRLYLTTKWQNTGDRMDDSLIIAADVAFCGRHRREENQNNDFRFIWKPFPETDRWEKGDVWSSTGFWNVPSVWGASYQINISLIDKNGKTVEFLGKDGIPTFSQKITEIDLGWGWGRSRLLEQRKPVSVQINEESKFEVTDSSLKELSLGKYKFNYKYPAICGFDNKKWYDIMPSVTIRRISDNEIYKIIGNDSDVYSVNQAENSIAYYFKSENVCFCAEFILQNNHIELDIKDIFEKNDYELISVEIPSLIQENDNDTSLLNYFSGGKMIKLSDALTQSVEFYYDTCNTVSTASKSGAFCLLANDVDNVLRQSVIKKSDNSNTAVLGAELRLHIKANKPQMKSIPVKTKPLEIHFDSKGDWQYSAKLLNQKIPSDIPRVYEDTLMYKIGVDSSAQYNPENPATYASLKIKTLSQVRKILLRMYELSGGMKQVVYLCGWQTGGHDFEYPYPHRLPFNPKCGTKEEFNALREEMKQYNILLSFHDNFDDAYLSDSYDINSDILALDEYGKHWKGWLWAGGMSFIVSPCDYVKSKDMTERIEKTLSDYGIEKTYHLDVLTSEVRRYNFNQNHLSSAGDNIDAKIKIIESFNDRGIDITSETLSMPFIGKINYAQGVRYKFGNELFYGDKEVPLTTAAFHGFIPYVIYSDDSKLSLLRSIAGGTACSMLIENTFNEVNALRNLYISSKPMNKLAFKKILNTEITNSSWKFIYEDNSSVFADFKNLKYKIICDGRVISENFTTFMREENGDFSLFSVDGGEKELNLPDDWKNVTVAEIGSKDKKEQFSVQNGKIKISAKSDTAYIIRQI